MLIQLLKPKFGTYVWQIIIILIILLVLFVILRWLYFSLKRKKSRNNNINLILFLLLFPIFGCTNEDIDEKYDLNSLTSEFDLEDISNQQSELLENAIHFETIEDAREFLKYASSGIEKIDDFAKNNPKFLELNKNFEKDIVVPNVDPQLSPPIERSIPHSGGSGATYDGYYTLEQPYLSLFGCSFNYISVSFDGRNSYNGYNTFFIHSSFYGCTLGIEYLHIDAQEEYFSDDELGFTLEFQITLVLVIEGLGKVYSYPPERHFGRYNFRLRQGAIYDLGYITIHPDM